jgi:hypothetical protein
MKQKFSGIVILIVILSALTTAGCKKDPADLIVGTWKLTALTADVPYDWNFDGVTETNLFSVFTACQKENELQLIVGGGRAKNNCNDTGRNIQWFKNYNVTWLEIWESVFAGKYEVKVLSKTRLVMRKRVFLTNDYHTYTFTRV